jgi:hypothetical protein
MHEFEIAKEAAQIKIVKALAEVMAENVDMIWRWGDGYGGAVMLTIEETFAEHGYQVGIPKEQRPVKDKEGSPITKAQREIVIARDGLACHYCETMVQPKNFTVDHKLAIVNGGNNELDNLVGCCKRCNSRKSDKPYDVFVALMAKEKLTQEAVI